MSGGESESGGSGRVGEQRVGERGSGGAGERENTRLHSPRLSPTLPLARSLSPGQSRPQTLEERRRL